MTKLSFIGFLNTLHDKKEGNLILVSAISPTPAGEGKTTTTVGLGDGLNRIGKKTLICLREPSLGLFSELKEERLAAVRSDCPNGGHKFAFYRRFFCIALANNLLAAMIDNHIHQGNAYKLIPEE